jgi:hypothetical protein
MTAAARLAPNPARNLAREMEAATILKDQLKTIFGEQKEDTISDSVLLLDMIEGETNLLETLDIVLRQIGLDQTNVAGIEQFEKALRARNDRVERRVETLRTMLVNALEILDQKRFERPLAALTLKAVPAKLQVTDEAAIPSQWWKPSDPTLDRKGLGEMLKGRQHQLDELNELKKSEAITEEQYQAKLAIIEAAYPPIPGAELGNGGVTVQIKFS